MSREEQPKRSAPPVGHQLRRAREQLGLNMSDVADQQHLRTSVIQAIEEGDYSKVDTELFLKGYVRAYARQVQLDADAIIRDLDAELEPLRKERERQHEADPLVDIERRKRRKRRIARAAVVLLVLAGIGFGVVTWLADGERRLPGFGADSSAESDEPAPAASDEDVLLQSSENTDDLVTEEPQPEITSGPADTEDTVVIDADMVEDPEQAQALEDEQRQAPREDSPQALNEDTQLPAENQPQLVTDPAEATQAEAPEQTEPPAVASSPEAPVEQPAGTEAALRMSFSDDCWVQITDAEGNSLSSSLHSQGDVLEVEGVAPLNVIVGAMSAVESLEFQGETVDLESFRVVNNRAQFTLEP